MVEWIDGLERLRNSEMETRMNFESSGVIDSFMFWVRLLISPLISSVTWSFYHPSILLAWLELTQDILFEAFVKGVVSLIYFSVCLPFVHRRATYLISYPASLLESVYQILEFPVEFLGSLIYTVISSSNKDTLTSSILICILLISFSCFLL